MDLQQGYTFDDAEPAWVLRTLRRGVRQWEAAGDAPPLMLLVEGSEPLPLGGCGPEIRGTAGELLLWLARGVEYGLSADAELPVPPPWS